MPTWANFVNTDLKRGFTVPQVVEKHACPVGPEDGSHTKVEFILFKNTK